MRQTLPNGTIVGAGEANSVSNVGTAGVGVFKQKSGVDLQLKKINAGSSKVTITDDTTNSEIDVDVVETNINRNSLGGGALTIANGGSGATSASAARAAFGLGTAATLNVPASGNAVTGEIVKGDDTRLSNARTPLSHAHDAGDLTSGTLAAARMPALTGDVTTTAGSVATTLANVGMAGTFTKVTTDVKGRVTSGTTLLVSDLPVTPKVKAIANATQSIPNATYTDLNLATEEYDTDTIHDNVTNNPRLTCKTPGVYTIIGNVHFDASSVGMRIAAIFLNNTTYLARIVLPPVAGAGNGTQLTLSVDQTLALNDYITLRVYQDSGGALNSLAIFGGGTLSMKKIP